MSRSNKSKIAVTLLGSLAFGANAQAQDLSKNKITRTGSFSVIEDSKLGNKSPQIAREVKGVTFTRKNSDKHVVVRTNNFSVLGKPAIGVCTLLACNELLGAISGKSWYKGKYSIVNAARLMLSGKQNDKNPQEQKNNIADSSNKLKKIDNSSVQSLVFYITKVLNSFDKLPEILSEKPEWMQEINADGNEFVNDELWKQVEEYVASQELECLSRITKYDGVPGKSVVLLLAETIRRSLDNCKPNDNDPNASCNNNVVIERFCTDNCYYILITDNQFGEISKLSILEDGSVEVQVAANNGLGLIYKFTLLPRKLCT